MRRIRKVQRDPPPVEMVVAAEEMAFRGEAVDQLRARGGADAESARQIRWPDADAFEDDLKCVRVARRDVEAMPERPIDARVCAGGVAKRPNEPDGIGSFAIFKIARIPSNSVSEEILKTRFVRW